MIVTYPLLTVVDDAGAIVTGATVAVASLKDKANADADQSGLSINKSGPNVSVDYDAEAHGDAWITLAISKAGSTITGRNASPSFWLGRATGRIMLGLDSQGRATLVPAYDAAKTAASAGDIPSDYQRRGDEVVLPFDPPEGYGPDDFGMAAVAGATLSSVTCIVEGLPDNSPVANWKGKKLYVRQWFSSAEISGASQSGNQVTFALKPGLVAPPSEGKRCVILG